MYPPGSGRAPQAVFFDPPYLVETGRDPTLYTVDEDGLANRVRAWALEHGDDPLYRIALCGYEGEHEMPDTWERVAWKSQGGYAGQGADELKNAQRERIWFSPHCRRPHVREVQDA